MIQLRASAKINLYLRVLGRRPDGYHEIETVFERIDLADELTFEPADAGINLTCSDPTLSCGEDNLVLKAARLLQRSTGNTRGARIHLLKRIPIAAGLGGGSSDGASALRGLNHLWELGLTPAQLHELAAQLGSDVAFFLEDAPFAIGRGRGERCEPIAGAASLAHVLVTPNIQLSTKEIYEGLATSQHVQKTFAGPAAALPAWAPPPGVDPPIAGSSASPANVPLTTSAPSINMLVHALRNGSALAGLAEGIHNDLEPEAIRRCPVIARIQSALQELGCLSAHVSGSGPTVVGLCRDIQHAAAVAGDIRQHGERSWRVEMVRTDTPQHVRA